MDQSSRPSQNSPVDDTAARGVNSRHRSQQDLMEIRRQRQLNKARKEREGLDQNFILENLAKDEPSAVTFLDNSRGIEFEADGNEIPRNPEGFVGLNPTALPQPCGNPDGAAPFYPAYPSKDNPCRHQDPQSHLFTAGVYPTKQPLYPHQPLFQPVNQPPANQQAFQPVDQPVYQPGNQPINQPRNQPINLPVDQQIYQLGNQPINQPRNQPINLPVDQKMYQLGNQPINQPMNQNENPQINQWNMGQYPQNATPQPYNPQNNVWSTNQPDEITTQQPHSQTDVIIKRQDEDQTCTSVVYLIISVFAILFCCCPLGTVGLAYSLYAYTLNTDGDFTTAKRRADTACRYNIAAVLCGVVIYGVSIAVVLISSRDETKQ
ncbi:uncharacterized protein LOC131942768 [Physella acuta]|uniref:uncharacterized protein LOC131942768 n=1 Tax=Physella acuta TaxID=109671 RepID=UPI0027DB7D54|nr:uncharacterized protein LOC131942768 [Physella acuta]